MLRLIALVAAATVPNVAMAEMSEATVPVQQASALADNGVDWTGISVGLELGYIAEVEDNDGFLYGARLAYDYDFGNLIVGGFLQYASLDLDFDDGNELVSLYRVGVRGGVDSGQNWYYASTGYTMLDTHGDTNPGDGDGYFLGAGYERILSNAFTLGAEIVYSDYGDFDRDSDDIDVTTLSLSLNYRF